MGQLCRRSPSSTTATPRPRARVFATLLDKAPAGGPVRTVAATETVGVRNGIARADVAAFLLAQAQTPDSIGTTALITTT
jgi:hypothetical protein